MNENERRDIIKNLFPERRRPAREPILEVGWNRFTAEKFIDAGKNMKVNKAGGPNAILVEIIKVPIEGIPKYVLKVMNACMEEGKGPARVVLVQKPRKNVENIPSSRPICLLNIA